MGIYLRVTHKTFASLLILTLFQRHYIFLSLHMWRFGRCLDRAPAHDTNVRIHDVEFSLLEQANRISMPPYLDLAKEHNAKW